MRFTMSSRHSGAEPGDVGPVFRLASLLFLLQNGNPIGPSGRFRAARRQVFSEIAGAGLRPTPIIANREEEFGDISKFVLNSIRYNFLAVSPVVWVNRLD